MTPRRPNKSVGSCFGKRRFEHDEVGPLVVELARNPIQPAREFVGLLVEVARELNRRQAGNKARRAFGNAHMACNVERQDTRHGAGLSGYDESVPPGSRMRSPTGLRPRPTV